MEIRQELLYRNPSNEQTRSCDRMYRGIVQAVYFRELAVTGENFWQTYCDVQLVGLAQPNLRKVPLAVSKSNLNNGEDWTPEEGDIVLVQFIAGRVCDPVITGFLFPWDSEPGGKGLQPGNGEVPAGKSRYYKRCNGTSEKIDKDGNRIVEVAKDETVTISGNGTLNVTGEVTINVTGNVTVTTPSATIDGDLHVTGSIVADGDVSDHTSKSMAGMRTVFDAHTHPETGSTTSATTTPM